MSKSLDGVLIKKANKRETFTNDQVEQLLKCSDPKLGYDYFARNFAYIQHPVKGKLLFDPFEYQTRLLASYHDIDLILICCLDKQEKLLVPQFICCGTLCLFLIKLY